MQDVKKDKNSWKLMLQLPKKSLKYDFFDKTWSNVLETVPSRKNIWNCIVPVFPWDLSAIKAVPVHWQSGWHVCEPPATETIAICKQMQCAYWVMWKALREYDSWEH